MRIRKIVCAVVPVAAAVCGLAWAGNAEADTYNGNGATGFGGGIGNSTLTVTDGGATINFSMTSTGYAGNGLALYLDTVAGGFNDTSTFNDDADGGRTVLSGFSTNGRTLATFAPGFGADYGISVEPENFAGLFNLSTGSTNFTFVNSANLDTSSQTTVNFSINKADVGLPLLAGSFSFEASLISTSAYRSNETIGDSVTLADPTNPGTAPNAGFTGTTTFSDDDTFTYGTATPEPTSLALLGLVVAGPLAGRRRRRQV